MRPQSIYTRHIVFGIDISMSGDNFDMVYNYSGEKLGKVWPGVVLPVSERVSELVIKKNNATLCSIKIRSRKSIDEVLTKCFTLKDDTGCNHIIEFAGTANTNIEKAEWCDSYRIQFTNGVGRYSLPIKFMWGESSI